MISSNSISASQSFHPIDNRFCRSLYLSSVFHVIYLGKNTDNIFPPNEEIMGTVYVSLASHKPCAHYLNIFTLLDTSKPETPPEVMT